MDQRLLSRENVDILTAIVGIIAGWVIAALYYRRSLKDLRLELGELKEDLAATDTVEYFHFMLSNGTWTHQHIGGHDTWVCDQRSVFKIVRNDDFTDFHEEWTRKTPDQNTCRCTVDLKINDSTVRSLYFILLDGGRYLVPMPERSVQDDTLHFFWRKESLEFKCAEVIGEFYRFDTIEEAALFFGIDVLAEPEPHHTPAQPG